MAILFIARASMAKRNQLTIIRAARSGQAAAQLALGKHYLFGSAGLPKSLATALHWLDRAARQHERDSWLLIGSHIPFETALRAMDIAHLCVWYEKAFDAGVLQAGLVLAKLVQARSGHLGDTSLRSKALHALHMAAQEGIADAQWLLAQQSAIPETPPPAATAAVARLTLAKPATFSAQAATSTLEWTKRAAQGGVSQARKALAEHYWRAADYSAFLSWSLPLARQLISPQPAAGAVKARPSGVSAEDARLLTRSAHVLSRTADADADEVEKFWECAALAGDTEAQLSLGLWLARMDIKGERTAGTSEIADYKGAIRWLSMAGERGLAEAWYAISRIYRKRAFSQRKLSEALRYLELAAQGGCGAAQWELGAAAWRGRRHDQSGEECAIYWLQKAAAQGSAAAGMLLKKVAASADPAPWALALLRQVRRDRVKVSPPLMARIELAALFGLSRPDALLIDLNEADRGHCLIVDHRTLHARCKRRVILVQEGEERRALNRIARVFADVDCGLNGPDGSYRQRLYRLNALAADAVLEPC